jgi:tetratricopeptide (TPR) repeat protein
MKKRAIVYAATIIAFFGVTASAQENLIYTNLPVGKYAVGFKIFTLTDESRVDKPEYNYLGEKNEGDRRKKITIHLWYPAKTNTGQRAISYGDYCYNSLLTNTSDVIDKNQQEAGINSKRRSVENWFGKTTDEAWNKLIQTSMLAKIDAEPLQEKFPLLVGTLRDLSTSVTNEMLTSNGYVVAMIKDNNFTTGFAESALQEIPDMQFSIMKLEEKGNIDAGKIGTFGFSGSGFSQVLFSMYDYRIKAVADIESGIYMDQLYQNFSASNYYHPNKLYVPFLHIFSRDLSKQEKFIDDFENKTKFATRYRLILNQPALHHWDFAAEGFTASIFLNNRGEQSDNIRQSFEIASIYLLNFFNAVLKDDTQAKTFLASKPTLRNTQSSLWDITTYAASKPAPAKDDFDYIVKTKGFDEAISMVKSTIKNDTLTDLYIPFVFNRVGYNFLNEKKYAEAISIFKLNTELHPNDPNLFDSLAEAYELSGDKENMKKTSLVQIEILNKKDSLSDFEKGLKANAEKRLN